MPEEFWVLSDLMIFGKLLIFKSKNCFVPLKKCESRIRRIRNLRNLSLHRHFLAVLEHFLAILEIWLQFFLLKLFCLWIWLFLPFLLKSRNSFLFWCFPALLSKSDRTSRVCWTNCSQKVIKNTKVTYFCFVFGLDSVHRNIRFKAVTQPISKNKNSELVNFAEFLYRQTETSLPFSTIFTNSSN